MLLLLLLLLSAPTGCEWSSWSRCSHSCGGGIQTRSARSCDQLGDCQTTQQAWRACGLHLCPSPFISWRDQQCGAHNTTQVDGVYHTWVSTVRKDAPCSLDCRAVDSPGLTHRFSDLVQDGTVCGEGALKLCLAGGCEEVGCDLQLRSSARLDRCGVCGGSGKSCGEKRYGWRSSGLQAKCSVTCGGGRRVTTHYCQHIQTSRKVHFGFCDPKKRPQDYYETCNNFPCPAR